MVRPRVRRTRTGTTAGTRAAAAAIAMMIATGAMTRIIWPDTRITLTRPATRCPAERSPSVPVLNVAIHRRDCHVVD